MIRTWLPEVLIALAGIACLYVLARWGDTTIITITWGKP